MDTTNRSGKVLWQAMIDACYEDDLDEAVRPIQEAIGQDDGGQAGIFFSGPLGREWPRMSPVERASVIHEYVKSELHEPEWQVHLREGGDA